MAISTNFRDLVRVRIAPAPTGLLHLGTARTALFNFLFAKSQGGSYILRIEDTDRVRSRKEFEIDIIEGLRWLGISWDEGPDVGGPFAPYRQSERLSIYRDQVTRLLSSGKAYRCFCSKERLENLRRECLAQNRPFRYDNKCRAITEEESGSRAARGEQFVVRLRVDITEPLTIRDIIRGEVRFAADTLDDFVISKGCDVPLYHLAVTVDDATMKISHVIRGEDLLSSTPKHILLQRALGFNTPQYAHLPLILDSKGGKLSKRSGDTEVTIRAFRRQGYLPQALANALALLGWNPKSNEEIFAFDDLLRRFNLNQVQKSGAVFSIERLRWINRQHLRRLSKEDIFVQAKPFIQKRGFSEIPEEKLKRAVFVERERITTLSELPLFLGYLKGVLSLNPTKLIWHESTAAEARAVLSAAISMLESLEKSEWEDQNSLRSALLRLVDDLRKERGTILWPIRFALSGQEKSPGPDELAWVLGRAETLRRLRRAYELL